MSIKLINTSAVTKYVSKKDSDYSPDGNHGEGATVWILSKIDSYVQGHIKTKATNYTMNLPDGVNPEDLSEEELDKYVTVKVDIHGMAMDTCKFCLKGWENAQDEKGNAIPYTTKKVSINGKMYDAVDSDLLARIPSDILMELYKEISKESVLTEEEAKNSAAG